jgi:hypothetical protein
MTKNFRLEAEQLTCSAEGAEGATPNPVRGQSDRHSARRLELSFGTGSNGCNNSPTSREQTVRLAECMRESGGRDFPDVPADWPLVDQSRIPCAAARDAQNISGLSEAAARCTDLCSSASGGQGQ